MSKSSFRQSETSSQTQPTQHDATQYPWRRNQTQHNQTISTTHFCATISPAPYHSTSTHNRTISPSPERLLPSAKNRGDIRYHRRLLAGDRSSVAQKFHAIGKHNNVTAARSWQQRKQDLLSSNKRRREVKQRKTFGKEIIDMEAGGQSQMPETAPNGLIAALEANYHAQNKCNGQRPICVRDCLRSKSFPHPKVKRLIKQQIDEFKQRGRSNSDSPALFHRIQEAFDALRRNQMAELPRIQNALTMTTAATATANAESAHRHADIMSPSSMLSSVSQSPTSAPPSPTQPSRPSAQKSAPQNPYASPRKTETVPATQPRRPSLYYLSHASTIMRFIQYLVELRKQSISLSSSSSSSNDPSPVPLLSPPQLQQLDKWVIEIIQNLGRVICAQLNGAKHDAMECILGSAEMRQRDAASSMDDDGAVASGDQEGCEEEEEEQDNDDDDIAMEEWWHDRSDTRTICSIRHVCIHIFISLLRCNAYARERPQLAGPLWKTMGEIISAFHVAQERHKQHQQQQLPQYESSPSIAEADISFQTLVPSTVMEEAVRSLSDLCNEGCNMLLNTAAQVLTVPSSKLSTIPPRKALERHGKLVSFLVTRLVVMVNAICQAKHAKVFRVPQESVSSQAVNIMLRLRGLAMALSVMDDEYAREGAAATKQPAAARDVVHTAVLQILMDVAARVERQMMGILVCTPTKHAMIADKSAASSISIFQLRHAAVQHVIQAQWDEENNQNQGKRQKQGQRSQPLHDAKHYLSRLAWSLGKALMLRRILAATSTVEYSSLRHLDDTTVENLLAVIEQLLCVTLADCQTPLLMSIWKDETNFAKKDGAGNQAKPPLIPSLFLLSSSIQHSTKMLLMIGEWHPPTLFRRASSRGGELNGASVACKQGEHHPKMKLHRLMIAWLGHASSQPFAREIMVALFHLFIVSVSTPVTSPSTHPDTSPFVLVETLIQLVFEPRTSTQLRESVASILMKVFNTTANRSTLCTHLRTAFEHRLHHFLRQSDSTPLETNAKRKRASGGRGKRSCTSRHFQFANDNEILRRVLRCFAMSKFRTGIPQQERKQPGRHHQQHTQVSEREGLLLSVLQSFCETLIQHHGPAISPQYHDNRQQQQRRSQREWSKHIAGYRAQSVPILLSMLSGLPPQDRSLQKHLKVDAASLHRTILGLPFQRRTGKKKHAQVDNQVEHRHDLVLDDRSISILDAIFALYACWAVEQKGSTGAATAVPVAELIRLITAVLDATSRDFASHQKGQTSSTVDTAAICRLRFTAIRSLRFVSNVIPTDCHRQDLQQLAAIFSKLLSTCADKVPIMSSALTAYEGFGKRLHPGHRHILRSCCPSNAFPIFQCRFQQLVWRGKSKATKLVCPRLHPHAAVGIIAGSLRTQRTHGRSIFPSPSVITVPTDSYVFQVTLPSGLKATVLMPPDPSCWEEIQNMAGMAEENDDEPPAVRLLRRSVPHHGSGGCDLILQQAQK